MVLMTIYVELMVMVTVVVRIAESKPDSFCVDFVSIVEWEGREVYSCWDVGPLWGTPGTAPPQCWLLPAPVTPHREPQLLSHLGAEALSVVHGVLATVPAELEYGHLAMRKLMLLPRLTPLTMMARASPHSSTTNTPPMF